MGSNTRYMAERREDDLMNSTEAAADARQTVPDDKTAELVDVLITDGLKTALTAAIAHNVAIEVAAAHAAFKLLRGCIDNNASSLAMTVVKDTLDYIALVEYQPPAAGKAN